MGDNMKDPNWIIDFCEDLCAYAKENNMYNMTSAVEHALEMAIQETEASQQLKRLVNSSQHVGTVQVRQTHVQTSCNEVILFPTLRK